jgi:short-subunit dehydrogenase
MAVRHSSKYFPAPKSAIGECDRGTEGCDRTALITGASSGIGLAMAELLAAKGFDVVLVARRMERLVMIAENLTRRWGVKARPLVADLALPSAPEEIAKAASNEVSFLVNNAGYDQLGRYDQIAWTDHEKSLHVMGIATLELTHRLLPPMIERGWGRIVNVSSVAGVSNSIPQHAMYGAVKSMVRSFSETIDAEFRDLGIRCTVSLPGFTATELVQTSGMSNAVESNRLYAAALMSPTTVARQAYRAVMDGRPTVIHGVHHRALAFALQHAPLPVRRDLANSLFSSVSAHMKAAMKMPADGQ